MMTKISQNIAAFTLAMTIVAILVCAIVAAVFGQNGQRPSPTPVPQPPYVYVELCGTNTTSVTAAIGTAAHILANEGCTDIHFRRLDQENWQIYGTRTIVVNN